MYYRRKVSGLCSVLILYLVHVYWTSWFPALVGGKKERLVSTVCTCVKLVYYTKITTNLNLPAERPYHELSILPVRHIQADLK